MSPCQIGLSTGSLWSEACNRPDISERRQEVPALTCSMGYPRYRRMPLAPSMKQILDTTAAVLMYPGSYIRRPTPSPPALILPRSVPLMVPPSLTGIYTFNTLRAIQPCFFGTSAAGTNLVQLPSACISDVKSARTTTRGGTSRISSAVLPD